MNILEIAIQPFIALLLLLVLLHALCTIVGMKNVVPKLVKTSVNGLIKITGILVNGLFRFIGQLLAAIFGGLYEGIRGNPNPPRNPPNP